jgi:hypothetical protein
LSKSDAGYPRAPHRRVTGEAPRFQELPRRPARPRVDDGIYITRALPQRPQRRSVAHGTVRGWRAVAQPILWAAKRPARVLQNVHRGDRFPLRRKGWHGVSPPRTKKSRSGLGPYGSGSSWGGEPAPRVRASVTECNTCGRRWRLFRLTAQAVATLFRKREPHWGSDVGL